MNGTGAVRTIASCHGHICNGRPYVYFEAPVEIAAAIEQRLRSADSLGESWRCNFWTVEGSFREDCDGTGEYKIAFTLHSPNHDENYWKIFWSLWAYWVMRKKLDAELLALSKVIEEAILLKLGKSFEPDVKSSNDQ
jgi:hypothetical protein